MKVYGQLENAQVENKASDYTSGVVGRVWWNNATNKTKLDDGTNIRALLRNDAYCLLGNHATAANNIRFHRGASGVLQFVTGDDATAEGTLSTTLNQISAKMEAYATGSLPATGNAGRLAWDTTTTTIKVDTGAAWTTVGPGNAFTSPIDVLNYSLTATVSANALTIALKSAAGSDPSSGDPVKISFRNVTTATGDFSQVNATAATSLVISSGSTLGHFNNKAEYVYIYAINNAGTIVLAASSSRTWDDGSVQSTTAEGGAGAADSKTAIYSTAAQTSKAIRLIGRILSTQTTAGTWAAAITEISLFTTKTQAQNRSQVWCDTYAGLGTSPTAIVRFTNNSVTLGTAITYASSSTLGDTFTINEDGIYSVSAWMYVTYTGADNSILGITRNQSTLTQTMLTIAESEKVVHGSGGSAVAGVPDLIFETASTCAYFNVGDVIRVNSDHAGAAASNRTGFRICKIGD